MGMAVVHVVFVNAAPVESFARLALQALGIHVGVQKNVHVGLGEIFADDTDDAGAGEQSGGDAGGPGVQSSLCARGVDGARGTTRSECLGQRHRS